MSFIKGHCEICNHLTGDVIIDPEDDWMGLSFYCRVCRRVFLLYLFSSVPASAFILLNWDSFFSFSLKIIPKIYIFTFIRNTVLISFIFFRTQKTGQKFLNEKTRNVIKGLIASSMIAVIWEPICTAVLLLMGITGIMKGKKSD